MAHLYASFNDAALAEKAAGALLDYGVRKEDISLVANDAYGQTRSSQVNDTATDAGRATANVGDGAVDATKSSGNRLAQAGDRMAGAVTGTVGATGAAAGYEAAGDARAMNAEGRAAMARNEDEVHGRPVGAEIVAGDTGTMTSRDTDVAAKQGISTTTPQDAGAGAVKGTEIGLGVGILAGIASLLVPGVGLVLGGGALAAALGGAALTAGAGAIAGGVTGYLKEQGVPGEAAQRYQGAVENGGAILNINLPSGDVDQATAEAVLGKYNALDVHSY